MKPEIDSPWLEAFVDGELDLGSRLELERRLEQDAALSGRVEALRLSRKQLREHLSYHAAPPGLRARLAESLSAQRPPPAAAESRRVAVRRGWNGWDWRPALASLGLSAAVMVGLGLAWQHRDRDRQRVDEVIASHVRSTLGQRLVDVVSSDHHTVKPWLSARLDFSPPVRELQIPGSTLLGARIDYLDQRPVAALVYRQGPHIVDAYVWPTRQADRPPAFQAERGFQLANWSRNGMTYWAISDVNRDEFRQVVQALSAVEPR